jgi:hypothetical protein
VDVVAFTSASSTATRLKTTKAKKNDSRAIFGVFMNCIHRVQMGASSTFVVIVVIANTAYERGIY